MHRWKAIQRKNGGSDDSGVKNSKRKHACDAMSFGTLAIGSPMKKKCPTPASKNDSTAAEHREFLAQAYSSSNIKIGAAPASRLAAQTSPKDIVTSDSSSTTISADDESSGGEGDASTVTTTTVIAKSGRWAREHDDALHDAVRKHGEGQWDVMAHSGTLRAFSPSAISKRWHSIKPNVKGPWRKDEDGLLTKFVKVYGTDTWSIIACHIPGRSGKQCRERWKNHLDPELKKTDWSLAEDSMLMQAQKAMGNKWSEIAKKLGGRSENAVKNRYYSIRSRIQNGISPRSRGSRSRSPRSRSPRSRNQKRPKSMPTAAQISSNASVSRQSFQAGVVAQMPPTQKQQSSPFYTTCDYLRLSHHNHMNKRYRNGASAECPPSRIMESTYNFLGMELRRSIDSALGTMGQPEPQREPETGLKQALKDKNEEIARLRVAISEVLDENLELRKQEGTVCSNGVNEDDSPWNSADSDDSTSENDPPSHLGTATPPDFASNKRESFSPPTIMRKGKTLRNKSIAVPTPITIPIDQEVKTANALLTLSTPGRNST